MHLFLYIKYRDLKIYISENGAFLDKINATTVVASTAKSLKYHSFSVQFQHFEGNNVWQNIIYWNKFLQKIHIFNILRSGAFILLK